MKKTKSITISTSAISTRRLNRIFFSTELYARNTLQTQFNFLEQRETHNALNDGATNNTDLTSQKLSLSAHHPKTNNLDCFFVHNYSAAHGFVHRDLHQTQRVFSLIASEYNVSVFIIRSGGCAT